MLEENRKLLKISKLGATASIVYIATILTANYVTNRFGAVHIGFGMTATSGTLFVGLALLLRNVIQDKLGRAPVIVAIIAGSVLSASLSPELAIASGCAFLLSELLDMAVYTPLRKRGYVRAVLPASFIGSVTDTLLFLYLAGFSVVSNATGQVIGKYGITVVTVIFVILARKLRQRDSISLES